MTPGEASDHGQSSDSDELENARHAPDDGLIVDFHVAGHGDQVGDGDVVAQDAVMRDVGIGHDEVAGSDAGLAVQFVGPGAR